MECWSARAAVPCHAGAPDRDASDRVWATVLLEGGSDGVDFDAAMVVKHDRQSKSTVISLL